MLNKIRILSSPILCVIMFFISACATVSGPIASKPKAENGHVVVMLSGKSGTHFYKEFSLRLKKLGFYVALFDTNELPFNDDSAACKKRLDEEIEKVLLNSASSDKKVSLIGYSLGGGLALSYASQMPERISNIIVYYPVTSYIRNIETFVNRFNVPIVVFQGENDTYKNCCTAIVMKEIDQTAKTQNKSFEVIMYPGAEHGFNLQPVPSYNRQYDEDSWKKTVEILKKYNP